MAQEKDPVKDAIASIVEAIKLLKVDVELLKRVQLLLVLGTIIAGAFALIAYIIEILLLN